MMTFGSLFSGIGGFDLAFERAGMECKWQAEIDKNCQNILERNFPETEKFYDIREVGRKNLKPVDLVCGGFPCQDLSVAGKRAGLAGERSGLWFEFARVIDELSPRWVVVENVPGLLSSNRGEDFAIILRWLVERGYGVCWRILDSQYFGVPQRRRRLFIIGSLGNGRSAEVLFEREGVFWDTPQGREERKDIAQTIAGGSSKCHSDITSGQQDGNLILQTSDGSLQSRDYKGVGEPSLNCNHEQPIAFQNTGWVMAYSPFQHYKYEEADISATLQDRENRKSGSTHLIAWHGAQITSPTNKGGVFDNVSTTMNGDNRSMVGVRCLTPTECERLQGFPDGWTDGQSDTVRYRQLGNAVTVNVLEWIGKRIVEYDPPV